MSTIIYKYSFSLEHFMSKNSYAFPLRGVEMTDVLADSPAHTGPLIHAVDFVCDEGTELLAAQTGEVVWVKDDGDVGGDEIKYWNDGNRVVIKHAQGEHSAYEHLRYKGVVVAVGDLVQKGQLIGYSGNTGYSAGPHLHFEVFRWTKENPDVDKDFETVPITWEKK